MSRCVVRCIVCTEMSLACVDRSRLVWIGWCLSVYVVRCLGCTGKALVGVDRARLVWVG